METVTASEIIGLLIATLGGTAVGLERQWSGHAEGASARFGGLRTFTMLGGVAGLSGRLWTANLSGAALVLLAGAVLIITAAYVAASRKDVDATTEVAALVVLAAGVLAGIGQFRFASAIIALESLLLIEKSRLHALVRRLDETGLRAGVRFAVMALVILPLLPAGPYGPLGGFRPRELWALVLFFSGLSFLGYVAQRIAGPRGGNVLAGALGGVISSTSVTLTFARSSRLQRVDEYGLAFGAVAASAVLYLRVLTAVAVLNRALLVPLLTYIAIPALMAAGVALSGLRRDPFESTTLEHDRNPLQLGAALQMVLLFQAVLMGIEVARRWGSSGILVSAAILGLTDVDALTMSMARQAAPVVGASVAGMALATGIAANTAMKFLLAIVLGSRQFKLVAGGTLAAMLAAAVIMLLTVPT